MPELEQEPNVFSLECTDWSGFCLPSAVLLTANSSSHKKMVETLKVFISYFNNNQSKMHFMDKDKTTLSKIMYKNLFTY